MLEILRKHVPSSEWELILGALRLLSLRGFLCPPEPILVACYLSTWHSAHLIAKRLDDQGWLLVYYKCRVVRTSAGGVGQSEVHGESWSHWLRESEAIPQCLCLGRYQVCQLVRAMRSLRIKVIVVRKHLRLINRGLILARNLLLISNLLRNIMNFKLIRLAPQFCRRHCPYAHLRRSRHILHVHHRRF